MKLQSKIAVLAASSVLLAGLAGCEREPDQTASQESAQESYGSAPGSTESGTAMGGSGMAQDRGAMDSMAAADPTITAKIKAAYVGEPDLSSLDINVSTENGVAVLTGSVDSQQAKDKAQRLAAAVEGVRSVDNRLEVKAKATS